MNITVIPGDKTIIVDNEALRFDFSAPDNLHALQWKGGAGHLEFTDAPNRVLAAKEYAETVEPYLNAWRAEKARRAAEANRPPTLEEARAAKLAEVMAGYEAAFAPLELVYPLHEREGWPVQESEARALLADPAADPSAVAPVLSLMASLRGKGESAADLAAKVLQNAAQWRLLYAFLTGQQQRMYAEVSALDDVETVRAYTATFENAGGF